jgi:two-component system, chemotaxis family, protein-glutamate methylesterase/glutaminase
MEIDTPKPGEDARTIIVIGSSTGGPRTLEVIFSKFPIVNAAIVIVQHMPLYINYALCKQLQESCLMNVTLANEGDDLEPGTIYIAPSEVHMRIEKNRIVNLFDDEKVQYVKPSIDVAMKSLVKNGHDRFIGVILTGMGQDGAEGIRHIKKIGGTTIAQNLRTCTIHSMPRAAFETGKVDHMLPPEGIRDRLIRIAGIM